MAVELRIELDVGWADCHLVIDKSAETITASYLTDGLGDLAASIDVLLAGASRSVACFEEEPGRYRWILERVGPDQLRVRVTATRGLAADPALGDDYLMSDAQCGLREFALAFLGALEQVRSRLGLAGYEREWRLPYPTTHVDAIRRRLAHASDDSSRPDV